MISSHSLESVPTDRLLRTILQEKEVVPVRPMEEVLRRETQAVPAVVNALHECPSGVLSVGAAWCLVLLGELRAASAVDTILDHLVIGIDDNALRAVAAAEALAKIGNDAVPRLRDLLADGDRPQRLYAYATLGWLGTDAALRILLEAVEWDTPMASVLALALRDAGRRESIRPLHGLLTRCAKHHRPEVERAIWALHHGKTKRPLLRKDWRLRYRPARIFSGFDPGWPAEMQVVFKVEEIVGGIRPAPPVRPLHEILSMRQDALGHESECSLCEAPAEPLAGIPACVIHAPSVIGFQLSVLEETVPEPGEPTDLFALMGAVDLDLVELYRIRLPPLSVLLQSSHSLESYLDDLPGEGWNAELMFLQRTFYWLIERGIENVPDALARLSTILDEAMRRLREAGLTSKFWAELEEDDDPLSIHRALYRVSDPDAVVAALDGADAFQYDDRQDSFIWLEASPSRLTERQYARRILGSVRVAGNRLALACLFRERLEEGRALLEALCGSWLSERAETAEPLWDHASPKDKDLLPADLRKWVDTPLQMLDGLTPRQAALLHRGREHLRLLLAGLEHERWRWDHGELGWVRAELGIEKRQDP